MQEAKPREKARREKEKKEKPVEKSDIKYYTRRCDSAAHQPQKTIKSKACPIGVRGRASKAKCFLVALACLGVGALVRPARK